MEADAVNFHTENEGLRAALVATLAALSSSSASTSSLLSFNPSLQSPSSPHRTALTMGAGGNDVSPSHAAANDVGSNRSGGEDGGGGGVGALYLDAATLVEHAAAEALERGARTAAAAAAAAEAGQWAPLPPTNFVEEGGTSSSTASQRGRGGNIDFVDDGRGSASGGAGPPPRPPQRPKPATSTTPSSPQSSHPPPQKHHSTAAAAYNNPTSNVDSSRSIGVVSLDGYDHLSAQAAEHNLAVAALTRHNAQAVAAAGAAAGRAEEEAARLRNALADATELLAGTAADLQVKRRREEEVGTWAMLLRCYAISKSPCRLRLNHSSVCNVRSTWRMSYP